MNKKTISKKIKLFLSLRCLLLLKVNALFLFLLMSSASVFAQGYQGTIKGNRNDEFCGSVKLGVGGNYVVVGNTNSYNNNITTHIFLSKFDPQGKLMWSKVITGINDSVSDFIATDIQASCRDSVYSPVTFQPGIDSNLTPGIQPMTCIPDDISDLYISGYIKGNNNAFLKMILIKTDNNGNVQWVRSGFTSDFTNYDEKGVSVEVASNKDVFIVGHAKNRHQSYDDHVSIARFSAAGNLRWFRRYNTNNPESFVPFQSYVVEEAYPDSPIGICITGEYLEQNYATQPSAMVMRVGYLGQEHWRMAAPSRSNLNNGGDGGYDIILDSMQSNNNFIITGYAKDSISGKKHTYLFRVSQAGNFAGGNVIQISQPNGSNPESYGQSIVLANTPSRVMIAGAYTDSMSGIPHTYMLKSTYIAGIHWIKSYPLSTANFTATESIAIHSEGDFLATNANNVMLDGHIVMPILNTGNINQNCEADTLYTSIRETGRKISLLMEKTIDTVRSWPVYVNTDVSPDTTYCSYEVITPIVGCCTELAAFYTLDSCFHNQIVDSFNYYASLYIDSSNCPQGTTFMYLDPITNNWITLSPGMPIVIRKQVSTSSSSPFDSFCVMIMSNSSAPIGSCTELLCMNISLPPCNSLPQAQSSLKMITSIDAKKDKSMDLNITPNPTSNGSITNLNYQLLRDARVNIRISDITGKLVHEMNTSCKQGNGQIELPISQLSPGMYFINCSSGDQKKTLRLIITK